TERRTTKQAATQILAMAFDAVVVEHLLASFDLLGREADLGAFGLCDQHARLGLRARSGSERLALERLRGSEGGKNARPENDGGRGATDKPTHGLGHLVYSRAEGMGVFLTVIL